MQFNPIDRKMFIISLLHGTRSDCSRIYQEACWSLFCPCPTRSHISFDITKHVQCD